ncbi:MAG: hypothetical protein UZ21_OP11001001178 [Microgenomates bacterium OLB22]|nr:MAG: hypothetical protein UZ21_OP11001001178 [Microgenomates bacterium OLB22]
MKLDDVEARIRSWYVDGHKLLVYSKGKYDCKMGNRPRDEMHLPGSIVIDVRMHTMRSLRRVDSISIYHRCKNWERAYISAALWKDHEVRIYRIPANLWEVRVFVTAEQFEQDRGPMPLPIFGKEV